MLDNKVSTRTLCGKCARKTRMGRSVCLFRTGSQASSKALLVPLEVKSKTSEKRLRGACLWPLLTRRPKKGCETGVKKQQLLLWRRSCHVCSSTAFAGKLTCALTCTVGVNRRGKYQGSGEHNRGTDVDTFVLGLLCESSPSSRYVTALGN